MSDLIDRQAAIDAINGLIDRLEQILRDIRETNVDDSVCGMCEYAGAYIGQSGDWYNECPGFDKDDCFKLSDECRKRWLKSVDLPSAQPEIVRCKDCKHFEHDHPYIIQGVPVLGHEVCNAWGDGCKTDENGWCFLAERRTDE